MRTPRLVHAAAVLAATAVLAAAGCTYVDNRPPRKAPGQAGIYHVVKKGENLYRIGKAYGISHDELARTNRVADARDLRIGRRLFIPGATRTLPVAIITPVKEPPPPRDQAAPGKTGREREGAERDAPEREAEPGPAGNRAAAGETPGTEDPPSAAARTSPPPENKAPGGNVPAPAAASNGRAGQPPPGNSSKRGFAWPVRGRITARFDPRHDSLNDGIDIAAPSGTQVRATMAGQVIYSDHLRGYGNLIIVRHRNNFASVYAHNRKNLVQQGQKVSRQQVIAEVGATGRVTTPQLHFEIRRNNVARNPLSYLP